MEHADFVRQLRTQYDALLTAARSAGPEARVPTCPEWTVLDLCHHLAGTHAWALKAVRTAPDAERPKPEERPRDWDELLKWWRFTFQELEDTLATESPLKPSWTFTGPKNAGFWARRQAHETAIHRLDAEHALHGPEVPTLLFDTAFAADGVDEYLTRMLVRAAERKPVERGGRLLFHAADAQRTWQVELAPGEAPRVGPVVDSGTAEDVTVAGTADAVYRAVWGRPSGAVVTGDRSLFESLPRA
ncbi:maleylpyruvate isomerase family mycothiol-dependent enzyme [Saccharothrix coeruleofusca]|uniref:Maleylpyruvate isomerase family mycothiol-dependent enzyme n=1 Tax=Saccharothrix coeruleofusca TaxID=33919 RepID=A0A918ANQ9_9PSEU|nr:maleylpyruvate isomerase family mycothiol-dependent enzyme [Saccharothrix coeruleofusca]GGP56832.1 hypothetical protein GCM10010185_31340 [Saccharothrix coeruleofusca]